MTQLYTVRLIVPAHVVPHQAARIEAVFSELLDALATSHQRPDDTDWEFEALFDSMPDAGLIDALLAPIFTEIGIAPPPVALDALPDRDWLAENRAAFPPLRIGRFWIYGSHISARPPAASLPLQIDAAMAFGSGTHPTTEGCLRAMQMIRDNRPKRVLDMGCGSAILAMAAGRLWRSSLCVAADNDPVAIRVAATNRRLNRIAPPAMRLAVSRGFGNRQVRQPAPYDLILANILAGPLTRMAPDLVPHLSARGWLVLSGILNRQATGVEAAYRAQGMRRWARLTIGDWTSLVMRPASAGQMPALWRGRGWRSR